MPRAVASWCERCSGTATRNPSRWTRRRGSRPACTRCGSPPPATRSHSGWSASSDGPYARHASDLALLALVDHLRQVPSAQEQLVHVGEQPQTVQAQGRIVSVHHDVVEEAVDGVTPAKQLPQERCGVTLPPSSSCASARQI